MGHLSESSHQQSSEGIKKEEGERPSEPEDGRNAGKGCVLDMMYTAIILINSQTVILQRPIQVHGSWNDRKKGRVISGL